MRPLGHRPAQPPRCVRERLPLVSLLTVAKYYIVGSMFSCSLRYNPRIPASSPGPAGYHFPWGLAFWSTRYSPSASVVSSTHKLKTIRLSKLHGAATP